MLFPCVSVRAHLCAPLFVPLFTVILAICDLPIRKTEWWNCGFCMREGTRDNITTHCIQNLIFTYLCVFLIILLTGCKSHLVAIIQRLCRLRCQYSASSYVYIRLNSSMVREISLFKEFLVLFTWGSQPGIFKITMAKNNTYLCFWSQWYSVNLGIFKLLHSFQLQAVRPN